MKAKSNLILKRMLACLLAVAMVLPQALSGQSIAYAAGTTTQASPVLSTASYRYMTIGESYDFNIMNKISGSSYKWESSNAKIASVNQDGWVKAMQKGTADITCTIKSKEDTYTLSAKIYVKAAKKQTAKKVAINNKIDYLVVGGEYDLNKTFVPSKANDYINWTSSNTSIATVDMNGIVTGMEPGLVTITATTLYGKIKDSVTIKVTAARTVSDQAGLESALKDPNVTAVKIETSNDMEFTIPEGNYTGKKLIVNSPNASVNNYGVFEEVNIEAIKGNTWHEFAKGNEIRIYSVNSSIVIEASASASVYAAKEGTKINLVVKGDADIYVESSVEVKISGTSGIVPDVHINHAGATISTELALNVTASEKTTLVINSTEAAKTTVKVETDAAIPAVSGKGSIKVDVNGTTKAVVAQADTSIPGAGSGSTSVSASPQVTATFGSPYVDGNIEAVWNKAATIIPTIYGKPVDTSAKYRLMWDDNALYVLAEIKDSKLDKSSGNAYQQDSLELFLDELYDKAASYQIDDVHYRVNYENFRTYDSGEKTRFYSKTKTTTNGYLVEACITWDKSITPANGIAMGFDLSVNAATNGTRDTTITIFDKTGNGYQNPSLFGKLVLEGKATGAKSGTNPYKLLTYIDSAKEIYLDSYINKDIITEPLANAEKVANNPASTQAEIDTAFTALQTAVNSLDDGSGYTKASALPLVAELPDVFTMRDGSKVDSLAKWDTRKQEIKGLYEYYMYGKYPDTSGEVVSAQYLSTYTNSRNQVVNAAPNQKFIKITVKKGEKTIDFIATASFPAAADGSIKAPTHDAYPVLIEIGSVGASQKKYLNDHGYAVVEFSNTEIAADSAARTGDFYTLYPYGKDWKEQTGVLLAWTWGVSKILDVITADAKGANELKISPVNTMVNGVSRNGKSAAVAGAFDSRIKITIPSSSGAGGLANFRYPSSGKTYDYSSLEKAEFIDFSGEANGTKAWQGYQDNPMHTVGANESLSNIQAGGEGHWFNNNFQGFSDPKQLPFDQHFLAALATGTDRYYYITTEVDGSDWLNASGMYVTYLATQNIFDSLGMSDSLISHFHSTGHAFTLEDVKYLVEFADKKFYDQVNGEKDLNHLYDNTLFSLPVNRDAYFDQVAAMNGPDLTPPITQVSAIFGSPYVDGNIEAAWDKVKVIVPKIYGKAVDTSAKYRLMWDDNALYVLAEIKDSKLDKSSGSAYQQDSLELFLDELYDKAASYQSDDVHYRVNFENFRTYDSGEKTRFYSKTKTTTDGYIVEACITWDKSFTPDNGIEMGFDLSVNAATNGTRDTTITIFDKTGNGYQNPSLFGKLVLEGKATGAKSGTNPYKLLTYIDSAKEIYLDAYINKEIITAPLAAAEVIANNPASTQEEIDAAFTALKTAVDSLNDGSGYTKPSALPFVSELPDVFTMRDGSKVETLADWEARKQEIKGIYEYYMYGKYPDTSSEVVSADYVTSYMAAAGWYNDGTGWKYGEREVKAAKNQKFIKVKVAKGDKSIDFIATASFPSAADGSIAAPKNGTYPVLIEIGSLGDSQKKYLNDHGYAVIEFNNNEIAADDASRKGDFYTLYPYGNTWKEQTGVLMAWGWGVSKIIDVIEADANGANDLKISPVNTMVNGVSRNGKSAAVAGAFDSRIKITIPSSSGAGGLASFRYPSSGKTYDYSSLELDEFIDFSGADNGKKAWDGYQTTPMHTVGANETLSNIQAGGEGHWFNTNFQGFSDPKQLPFDQHFLAALATGPDRYYYITTEVDGSDWLNAPGMYVTYLATKNIYDSLGISDSLVTHFHSTGHAFTLEDVKYLVEFADSKFYGQVNGEKNLNHLYDNTLFSLPVNRDAYFDVVAAMKGPDLTGVSLYSETFDGPLSPMVTTASGCSVTVVPIAGNPALKVSQTEDGFVLIPIVASGSSLIVTGSAVAATGAAASVTGSAIVVAGSALGVNDVTHPITISVSMIYTDDLEALTGYQIGVIESTDGIGTMIPMTVKTETVKGQNRGKWVELSFTYSYTGKDFYFYMKGSNLSSYYIDNIIIK